MHLAQPLALALFPLVVGAGVLLLLAFRWKDRVLQLLASGSSPSLLTAAGARPRQRWKATLILLALAALVVATARPFLGQEAPPPSPGQADLLVTLDVSLSMAAQDVSPSRLSLAKEEVLGLLERLQGERVGLVVFAGVATLRFPLTYDYDAAKVLVQSVEVDSAPSPGSALAEGVRSAVRGLRQSSAPVRAVLLLSDGEDLGGELTEAAQEAAQERIPIYVVGVGTAQGSTIPVPNPTGPGTTVKRDRSGQVVQTRLDEPALRTLAETTQGAYLRATSGGRELQQLYERVVRQGQANPIEAQEAQSRDLTPYLALLAFLLLVIDILIPERPSAQPILRPVFALLPLTILAAVACAQQEASAFDLNQTGRQHYQESQFSEALEAFRRAQVQRPDLPELNLNAGNALYKARELERALRETQRALSGEDSDLRAKAHFNMGNTYFQQERFLDALRAYKRALREAPDDLDAKINLELTLRQLQKQNQTPEGQRSQQQDPQGQQDPAGNQPEGERSPGNSGTQRDPQQGAPPRDPSEDLRRMLQDAGQELSIEEALRILDVLRERERQLQTQYNQQRPERARAPRPDKDW